MEVPKSANGSERAALELAAPSTRHRGAASSTAMGGPVGGRTPRRAQHEPETYPSLWDFVHALRMRWRRVLILGTLLAAALAAGVWQVVPTPYTAYSELRCQPRKFFWQTSEEGQHFDVYKSTMMRLVKDPFVINAALRDPKVAGLPYVLESDDIVTRLSNELLVTSPAHEFVRIQLSGKRPEELATLVNAITDNYITEIVAKESDSRRAALTDLKNFMLAEERKLKTMQNDLKQWDKQLEVANETQSDAKRQNQLDMQLEIRKQLSQLRPQIIEAQLLLSVTDPSAEPADGAAPQSLPQVVSEEMEAALMVDPEYAKLARERRYAEVLLKEWKGRVQASHPAIKRHTEALATAEQSLAERRAVIEPALTFELKRRKAEALAGRTVASSATPRDQLETRLKMLNSLKDRYEEELEKVQVAEHRLAIDWIEREALSEEIKSFKTTVDAYADEVLKREVELEKAPVPIRLHLRARTPTVPETKKRLMFTAMAGGGGFGFVLLLVLFFEVRARRIADLSTVRAHTSAPVLGVIPLVPYGARVGTPKKQRIAAAYWRSVLWEAFDGIRTVLLHNPRFRGPRVIMIASSSVGEGKSTSASQLAMSLARSGQRTLLLDGDIRRPTMEREFGLQKSAGFCEVLAGQLSLADAVRPSGLPELDLLPAGTLTEGVRSLLARDAHGPLFKEIGASYDFVIIDTSPVLLATDALLLARHVDGVIVLVRKDQTQLVKLENTLQRFDMIGVPILGLLPIGLDDTSPSYGYGYGYGYAYQYATPAPAEEEKTTLELPMREVTTSAT